MFSVATIDFFELKKNHGNSTEANLVLFLTKTRTRLTQNFSHGLIYISNATTLGLLYYKLKPDLHLISDL